MIDRFYVTTKGENLLAKAQGGAELKFTKIKVGDGVLAGGQSIQSLLDMISPKATFGISDKSVSGSSAVVTIMFTNQGITTGFLWREVGLYALDPTEGEILYAFGYDNATPIKIESASTTAMSFTYGMQTLIKNATNITAVIDPSAQFLKRQELEKYVAMENGESGQTVVTFTEQSSATVEEIVSGARLGVLIGKFKKLALDLLGFRDRPAGFATKVQGDRADSALQPAGNGSNLTNTFTQAANRTNLQTGEKLSVSLGKIMKWFADLKAVATSGSYNDLIDKPTSLPADGGDADTLDGKHATAFATAAQGTKADTALQSVPDATTSAKGIALLGVTGGAARYGQKVDVGLGNVDNTADSAKAVASAAKLTTARTISISGKATAAGVSFNGTANIVLSVTDVDATKLNGQDASYYGVAAKQYPFSVAVSAWSGTAAPYTATVTVTGVPANASGIIGLSDAASAEEREATRNAVISPANSTAANTVKLIADGDKPSIPLPMVATIVG